MKTEENKRMLALSYIVADLKEENMALVERNPHLSHLHFRTQFANTNIKKSNNET